MSRVQRRNRLQHRRLVLEGLERREVLTASFFVDGDALPGGDGSQEAPFATIRQGIEAALAAPGDDEVVIAPKSTGPYVEPLYIGSGYSSEEIQGFDQFNGNLVIRGSTGDADDVVLTSDVGSDIFLTAEIDVTIKDLTLSSSKAHGLVNRSPNNVVLDNLVVRDHMLQPVVGSGIVQQGANMTIRNSELYNNYQGIWAGPDQDTGEFIPGSLTIEHTVSHDNDVNGLHINKLTGSLTTLGYSGTDNHSSGASISDVPTVSISGGSFSNNHYKGIALWNAHGATIDGVLVEANGSLQGNDASGGAGIKYQPATGEPLLISNSTIRYNESNRWGGGFELYNFGAAPTITFLNTELSGNKSPQDSRGRGGAISVYGYGNLEIIDSKILNNEARVGGGVSQYSFISTHYLKVEGSTIDGNFARTSGGLDRNSGTTILEDSTFSHNSSTNGAGGLLVANSQGSMTNVTVSGNTSMSGYGGMSMDSGPSFNVVNSTFVDNTGYYVGGVNFPYGGRLANNVIAQNRNTYPYYHRPDTSGFIQSYGGNFVGDGSSAYGFNSTTDFVGTSLSPRDPKLGELADNGGKTLTHKPLLGSPLLDKGVTSAFHMAIPTTDQRGVTRPQRVGIDIGAVEAENNPPTLTAASMSVAIDEGQTAENSGTFSDLEGDAVTLAASVGSLTVGPDGTWQWSLGTDDGPGDGTTVTITAEDQYGAVSTLEFQVVVNNVAPTAQITAAPQEIQSGQSTTLTLGATDPSQADVAAGFTYQIDWDGDGAFDEQINVGTSTASHTFKALGVHTVSVVAVDKDGGTSDPVTADITVTPAPLEIVADASANLTGAVNGDKPFSVVVPSTATFDARSLNVASVVWAGAHVSRSSYRDVDDDGDVDAVFDFVLSESDAIDLYAEALTANPNNNHQTVRTELTAVDADGINYLGTADVDFVMNGKALKDLLDSI